jgi:hypothetical protein
MSKYRVLFLDGDGCLIAYQDVEAASSRDAAERGLTTEAGFAANQAIERGTKNVHITTLLWEPLQQQEAE